MDPSTGVGHPNTGVEMGMGDPRDPIRNKVHYIIDEWSPTRWAARAKRSFNDV